ncbi:MAG: translation elongation factor Ts [Armatimonadetes bacterium]|nr:translation elongation factor Ts [Armatimonadota bacterium]
MAITADMVKKLRDQTGAGMMDCKKALTETNGDYEKAITLLREKGIAVAAKREARSASEGLIASYISEDSKAACLLETNCETSFVAKTSDFVELAKNLAKHVAQSGCCVDDVEKLMDEPYPGGPTVRDRFTELMGKIGEKLAITRFVRLATDGIIGFYVHPGDQIAVLVELSGACVSDDTKNLAKDIAMHISWSRPDYMRRENISAEAIENEKSVHRQWAIKEGKPEKIIERIVEGRMKDFYSRVCLVEQPFIKDEDQTIGDLIKAVAKKTGEDIDIASYVRYRVGETSGDGE